MFLGAILTGLGFVAKLFGMVTLAEQLFSAAQQRQAGRTQQQAMDFKAALLKKQEIAQAAVNAPQDDKQVDDTLRQGKL